MSEIDKIPLTTQSGLSFKINSGGGNYENAAVTYCRFMRQRYLTIVDEKRYIYDQVDLTNPYRDSERRKVPATFKYLKASHRNAIYALIYSYLGMRGMNQIDIASDIELFHSSIQLQIKDLINPVRTS